MCNYSHVRNRGTGFVFVRVSHHILITRLSILSPGCLVLLVPSVREVLELCIVRRRFVFTVRGSSDAFPSVPTPISYGLTPSHAIRTSPSCEPTNAQYTYTCIYIYIYIYICIYTYVYTYIYIYIYVYTHVYYIYIYI